MTSTNKVQISNMFSIMSKNPDVARGFAKERKDVTNQIWEEIADELNNVGPPMKSVSEWKKVWIDQKRYIRKKAMINNLNEEKIGRKVYIFSPLEQSIYDIISPSGSLKKKTNHSKDIEINERETETTASDDVFHTTKEESFQQDDDSSIHFEEVEQRCTRNKRKLDANPLAENELETQEKICANLDEAATALYSQGVHRSLIQIHKILEQLHEGQNNLLTETRRHHLEMERLKNLETQHKLDMLQRHLDNI